MMSWPYWRVCRVHSISPRCVGGCLVMRPPVPATHSVAACSHTHMRNSSITQPVVAAALGAPLHLCVCRSASHECDGEATCSGYSPDCPEHETFAAEDTPCTLNPNYWWSADDMISARVSGEAALMMSDASAGAAYKTAVDSWGNSFPQCKAVCVRGKCTITAQHLGTCCHSGGSKLTSHCWMGGNQCEGKP
jgi:hypothetical protein